MSISVSDEKINEEQKRSSSPTFYRIGLLITGDGSVPQEDMLLSVQDGHIVDVLSAQSADPQLSWIDLRKYTVIPGMIDSHIHIMLDAAATRSWSNLYFDEYLSMTTLKSLVRAQDSLRAGFTTLRDLGCREYLDVALRDSINQGIVAGPRMFVSGVPMSSTGGHFDKRPYSFSTSRIPGVDHPERAGLFNSPDEARFVARHQVKMGVDWLKIAIDDRRRGVFKTQGSTYQQMSLDEMRAICEVGEWAGIYVAAHSDGGSVPMRDAVNAGVRTIEHIQDLSLEDSEFLAASDAYLVPTLTATYNTVEAGAEATQMDARRYGFFVDNWEAKKRGMANAIAAGVKIAMGTDAGYRVCYHGENAKELPLLVETGMSTMQALVAATGGAAKAMGVDELIGTLTPGKLADFVVVDGNPLDDIRLLTRRSAIVDVYKDGLNLAAMGL